MENYISFAQLAFLYNFFLIILLLLLLVMQAVLYGSLFPPQDEINKRVIATFYLFWLFFFLRILSSELRDINLQI